MGGGTSTTSTGFTNSQIDPTLTALLKNVQTQLSNGPTYTAPGATTQNAWQTSLNAAKNPAYSNAVNGALGYQAGLAAGSGPSLTEQIMGGVARGNNIGQNDPGYAALRSNLINDVTTQTSAAFNNSGLFGSDNNQTALAQGLGNALGSLDYNQYKDSLDRQAGALSTIESQRQTGVNNATNAAQMLPGLYQAGQLPANTMQAIGSAQDTATQNAANKNITLLQQLMPLLTGGTAASGQTNTQPTPNPLLALLGIGLGAL